MTGTTRNAGLCRAVVITIALLFVPGVSLQQPARAEPASATSDKPQAHKRVKRGKRRYKARRARRLQRRRRHARRARAVRERRAKARLAKKHNAAGRKYFLLGKFREAAAEYAKAYELKPAPAFLYNLGQCYKRMEGLEELRKAAFHFDAFLNSGTFSYRDREALTAELEELRRRIAKIETEQKAAREEERRQRLEAERAQRETERLRLVAVSRQQSAPPAKPAFYEKWWFWSLVGAAVIGATAGTLVAVQPSDTPAVMGTMDPGQIKLR